MLVNIHMNEYSIIVRFSFAVIDGNEIVYRDYVDISVAVASPKVIHETARNVE